MALIHDRNKMHLQAKKILIVQNIDHNLMSLDIIQEN